MLTRCCVLHADQVKHPTSGSPHIGSLQPHQVAHSAKRMGSSPLNVSPCGVPSFQPQQGAHGGMGMGLNSPTEATAPTLSPLPAPAAAKFRVGMGLSQPPHPSGGAQLGEPHLGAQ